MGRSRPRILYLRGHCPHAPSYGAQLRTLHIGRLLQRCGEVRLVLIRRSALDPAAIAKTQSEFNLEPVLWAEERPIRGLRNRWRHELDPWFLNTHGLVLKAEDVSHIQRLVAQ